MPISTDADIAALKTELQTDPKSLGYAALIAAGRDQAVADLLNVPGPVADTSYVVNRGLIPASEITAATTWTEYATITATLQNVYLALTGTGQVNVGDPKVKAAFAQMFAAGSATRTALLAIAQKQGSRAEVLFGTGTVVTTSNIGAAR